jgi:hypothetical protein
MGFGPTSQCTEQTIALYGDKHLSVSSCGRSHSLSVELLGIAEANGLCEASLSSSQVDGGMPHQAIDTIVTVQGHRVHVKSSGRSHSVFLKLQR